MLQLLDYVSHVYYIRIIIGSGITTMHSLNKFKPTIRRSYMLILQAEKDVLDRKGKLT
jgi:hypothetical protein